MLRGRVSVPPPVARLYGVGERDVPGRVRRRYG